MIDPKTLRIGNWVEHKLKKRYIEEIGRFGIDLYIDTDNEIRAEISYDELQGIGISPEILIDFGFEEIPAHIDEMTAFPLQRYNYRKTIEKDNTTYTFEYISTGEWRFQGIKLSMDPWHVHELQNLYYYLMNEELNFPKYE